MASSSNDLERQILQCTKYTWKLGRCLGRGTCSVVVEAIGTSASYNRQRKSRDIKAAVKIFKQGQHFEAAGANEIDILEYLRSQRDSDCKCYIVQLLDYFSYKGLMHLAYERLNCNLHHILLNNSGEGLPLHVIKECSRHILRALTFLADNMVVHGDVKMSNIMWNANRGMFQLVDFALSFLQGSQPYQPLQSPGYRSPEAHVWNRLLDEGTSDRSNSKCCCASDMWSFACVLWYIYTGQPASRVETDGQVCEMCSRAENEACIYFKETERQLPRDGRNITQKLHESFLDLINRMIKCRPEERVTPPAAIQHTFLESLDVRQFNLSLADMMLLPTTSLLLDNIYPNKDCLEDVKEMCTRFGDVQCMTRGFDGKVLVEYIDADDCSQAHRALTGWIFNDRTVISCYYPTGKASLPGLFNPVIPCRDQASHNNARSDHVRKRSPDSRKDIYGKCMKTDVENVDADLELKNL